MGEAPPQPQPHSDPWKASPHPAHKHNECWGRMCDNCKDDSNMVAADAMQELRTLRRRPRCSVTERPLIGRGALFCIYETGHGGDHETADGTRWRTILASKSDEWHCTRDGVTEPCGDCDGCRWHVGSLRTANAKWRAENAGMESRHNRSEQHWHKMLANQKRRHGEERDRLRERERTLTELLRQVLHGSGHERTIPGRGGLCSAECLACAVDERIRAVLALQETPLPAEYLGETCSRCGSTAAYEDCTNCDHGYSHHDCGEDTCPCDEPEDNVLCYICNGKGGWYACLSTPEWCEANPLPGRENITRGPTEEVRA